MAQRIAITTAETVLGVRGLVDDGHCRDSGRATRIDQGEPTTIGVFGCTHEYRARPVTLEQ
jgi:hypothetical protein